MWWASAIQGGLSFVGALGKKDAAKEGRKIAKLNAAASWAETQEQLRRMELSHEETEGLIQAYGAGSGFSLKKGTSQYAYLSAAQREHKKQREFVRDAGRREKQIIERGGQLAYRQGKASATASIGEGISNIAQAWALGKEQKWSLWG